MEGQKQKKEYEKVCRHKFVPLGFVKVSSDKNKVEVVAAISCEHCGMFRTKILYFDRQKDSPGNANN